MAYQNQKVKARQTVVSNQQTQTLGIVANVPLGEWSSTAQYQKLNTVRSHGATYQAKKANQGIEPTVTADWQEVWQVVAYDGVPSPNGNYPGMTVGNAMIAQNDSAGNNIADLFSTVQADIRGLREDVTNESHFRGMFQSVDALKAAYPTATPNDYAYIVGGNIWIYNSTSGWRDSEEPSPNTSVPAGNSTPLMDGAGSAGTSSEYARSDHRHPSDTSKVNKNGDTMTGNLTVKNGNPALYAQLTDDNWSYLGISADGKTRGIWDRKANAWLVHFDENNAPLLKGDKVAIVKSVSTDNNLVNEKSGFYENAFEQYSKYLVVGDGGDKFLVGWQYDSPSQIHTKVYNSGRLDLDAIIPYIEPNKLQPTTANGWTVGGNDLNIPASGIYLVVINTTMLGIMVVGYNDNGYARTGFTTAYAYVNNFADRVLCVGYERSSGNARWKANTISGTVAEFSISQVAYKRIA